MLDYVRVINFRIIIIIIIVIIIIIIKSRAQVSKSVCRLDSWLPDDNLGPLCPLYRTRLQPLLAQRRVDDMNLYS